MKIPGAVILADVAQALYALGSWIRQVADVVNGDLGFGDGTDAENIRGKWVTYTTNATPDTEDTITHGLGVIPIGWLVVSKDKAGNLYKGTTTWTTSSIYLKCDVASVEVKIFILTAPRTS